MLTFSKAKRIICRSSTCGRLRLHVLINAKRMLVAFAKTKSSQHLIDRRVAASRVVTAAMISERRVLVSSTFSAEVVRLPRRREGSSLAFRFAFTILFDRIAAFFERRFRTTLPREIAWSFRIPIKTLAIERRARKELAAC